MPVDLPANLFQVDAFSSRPFGGNPAAVCLLEREAPAAWMQALAAEMNLSETAFVVPRGGGEYGLRWFTPTVEVPLCGHATLASAHVLFGEGLVAGGRQIVFHTQSGALKCRLSGGEIELDFPSNPPKTMMTPPELEEIVGTRIVYTGRAGEFTLVEIGSEEKLRGLRLDLGALARSPWGELIVTCEGTEQGGYDFLSRFFAPAVGIPEDPVTGSAHCVLAPYWAKRLGRTAFRAHQASPRGGDVGVELRGERVILLGKAATVLSGRLAAAVMP